MQTRRVEQLSHLRNSQRKEIEKLIVDSHTNTNPNNYLNAINALMNRHTKETIKLGYEFDQEDVQKLHGVYTVCYLLIIYLLLCIYSCRQSKATIVLI
jgi:hypothetical protein